MSTDHLSNIEKTSLESHVELCALRYASLEHRLGTIESQVNNIKKIIEKGHNSTIKVLIGTAGTVIVGVLSTLAVILTKTH